MLSSCSDDLYHQGSKPAAKNETVSIEEFKRNTGLHNFSKTFKIPKDNTIAYRNADGSYELSDFDINFDYIKQVVVENKISYTFNIEPKIVTSKSIFNLVIYNHDGNWETSIIELIPTDENFDKLLAGIDNEFEGSIRQVYASRVQQDCNIIAYNVVRCIDPNSVKCRIECDKCADCLKLIFFAVCNGNDIVQPLYVLPGSSGGGSIGSGSGLSDPSGYIFDPNMYELGSKKYQQAKNAANFWHGLSISQQQWVYESEQNKETYRDIIAYINRPENINNTVVRNFGREIIEQMRLNPDTFTSIKPFLIEKQIDESFLDPCTKGIIGDLKNTINYDIATIIQKLDNPNSIYKTSIFNLQPSGPFNLAETNWDVNEQGFVKHYNYNIRLRPSFTNQATKLKIAATVIHELIHAYFLSLIDDCYVANNCTLLQTFPELWNFYVLNKNNGVLTNPISQHEELALLYVKSIAIALQQYHTGVPFLSGEPQQAYQDIAWGGLKGTTPYNNLSQEDKDRIDYRNNAEIYNQASTNPSGILVASPIGIPCN